MILAFLLSLSKKLVGSIIANTIKSKGLSFAENKGVAELIPEIALMTGAKGVVAAIDNEAWLPRGLAAQLRGWLAAQDVVCVTPKPLCTLTPTHYSLTRRQQVPYDHPLIAEFARYFGQPELRLKLRRTREGAD